MFACRISSCTTLTSSPFPLNKQVGGELGISEITVKAHRGKVMEKMKAGSLADLVKMASRLGIARAAGSDIMPNS